MLHANSTNGGAKRSVSTRSKNHRLTDLDEKTLIKILFLLLAAYVLLDGRVSIVIGDFAQATNAGQETRAMGVALREMRTANFGLGGEGSSEHDALEPAPQIRVASIVEPDLPNPSDRAKAARLKQYREYVDRFAPVAVAEMRRYGIPASIKLAQALLESQAGGSKLARQTNNHFGLKCFSQKCDAGHCVNHGDDSHKDFFIKYPNAWGSYRAHSELLKNGARYRNLFKYRQDDYISWAKGLAAAGYATDPQYADKLIAIVQDLQLDRYDEE